MKTEPISDYARQFGKLSALPNRVRIFKRYVNGAKRTPWKWHSVCHCGWNLLSWDWERSVRHVQDHYAQRHSELLNVPQNGVQLVLEIPLCEAAYTKLNPNYSYRYTFNPHCPQCVATVEGE